MLERQQPSDMATIDYHQNTGGNIYDSTPRLQPQHKEQQPKNSVNIE